MFRGCWEGGHRDTRVTNARNGSTYLIATAIPQQTTREQRQRHPEQWKAKKQATRAQRINSLGVDHDDTEDEDDEDDGEYEEPPVPSRSDVVKIDWPSGIASCLPALGARNE